MITKNKILCTLVVSLFFVGIFANVGNASAHSPRYIDLKYYDDDVLSLYITHGVSDSEYHYVETVIVEYYMFSDSFIADFTDNSRHAHDDFTIGDGNPHNDIIEADVDLENFEQELTYVTEFKFHYRNQETHQIFHYNYSAADGDIDVAPEWTLIKVTAICNLGGYYTHSIIVGHNWYDPEHSMIEALVPTIICSIVTMTPLAIWRIMSRKKKDKKKSEGVKH